MTMCDNSQQKDLFGMESESMSSPEDSPANPTALPPQGKTSQMLSRRNTSELSRKSGQNLFCQRTSCQKLIQNGSSNLSSDSVTESQSKIYGRLILGQTIKEVAGGYLHTPTTMANFLAPSMSKHRSCRNYATAFGAQKITPEQFEFLMGFPIGHTDLDA